MLDPPLKEPPPLHPAIKLGIWIICIVVPWALFIAGLDWIGVL